MSTAPSFFSKHQETLEQACQAISKRGHWSPYPEVPSGKIYGEQAKELGLNDYENRLGKPFSLKGPQPIGSVGAEVSPYSGPMGIRYDIYPIPELIDSALSALSLWRDAGPAVRTGVCLEVLERLNQRSFEVANATMNTTGQGFAMAFQAGGPHAQDRALEALASVWLLTRHIPESSVWNKPQGKHDPLRMDKRYHIVPKGISLVVACSTFPTWNTYPGLFASLVTGNPVIIKPHAQSVLPIAITVEVIQQVLEEAGFDPHLVQMAAEDEGQAIAQDLAVHPKVKIIDYTGGNTFGDWLSANATQAKIYKEQAGVNTVLIDSVNKIESVLQNLAFSLSLYSGQMCTTPQALLIPRDGIETSEGHLSFSDIVERLSHVIEELLSDPARAAGILGAIPNPTTICRIDEARALGEVVLESKALPIPGCEGALYHTPLLLKAEGDDSAWQQEQFGPISFVVAVDNTDHGLSLIADVVARKGAITFGVYSMDDTVLAKAEQLAVEQGVSLSCNLDRGVYVNQSAAFSDFHASGNNPAANASLTNAAFVADRFAIVQSRRHCH